MSNPNKTFNEEILHQTYQIQGFLLDIDKKLCRQFDNDLLKNLLLLNKLFYTVEPKFTKIIANNIAEGEVIPLFKYHLEKYLDKKFEPNTIEFNCLQLICSLFWNASDSSFKFCKALIEHDNIKSILRSVLLGIDENLDPCNLGKSIPSIIHNVTRREELRSSFLGDYKMKDRLMSIFTNADFDLKLVCLVSSMEMLKPSEYSTLSKSSAEIQESVVLFLDGVSNDENYRCEGFSSEELLCIIVSLIRIKDVATFLSNNKTFESTLLRLLIKNHKTELVIDVIKTLYSQPKRESLMKVYQKKCENPIQDLIDKICG